MGQQKKTFYESKVLQRSKMTAVNTMKDQRSLHLCKNLCCLTLVINCADDKTYIFLNQDNEFFFFFRNYMFGKGQIRDTCFIF